MRRLAANTAFLLLLGGCAFSAPEDSYSVEEVLADISSEDSKLDGKEVIVHGWLGRCGGLDCGLYQTLDDAKLVAQYQTLPDEEWMPAMNRRLGIGFDEDFDSSAYWMEFSEVVVSGEVNASWKKPPDENGTTFACFDRCDDIQPSSIKKILF